VHVDYTNIPQYTYENDRFLVSIKGVLVDSCRELHGRPSTAHRLYAFSTFRGGYQCGGLSGQNKTKQESVRNLKIPDRPDLSVRSGLSGAHHPLSPVIKLGIQNPPSKQQADAQSQCRQGTSLPDIRERFWTCPECDWHPLIWGWGGGNISQKIRARVHSQFSQLHFYNRIFVLDLL